MARSKITTIGRAKLAVATPEDPLHITHIAVSDGPAAAETGDMLTLPGTERWRGAASAPIKNAAKPGWLGFEAVIPGNHGGYTIRWIGLFDAEGDLIAVAQTGAIEKAAALTPEALTLTLRPSIQLDSSAQVSLVYSDQGAIDHQGLTNRAAADCHPISAIGGLEDALGVTTIFCTASTNISAEHLKSGRLTVIASAQSATTIIRLPTTTAGKNVDITVKRAGNTMYPVTIQHPTGSINSDDYLTPSVALYNPGEAITLRADPEPTRNQWIVLSKTSAPYGAVWLIDESLELTPYYEGLNIIDASAEPVTLTLPVAAGGVLGREYVIKRADSSSNAATITASGTDKIVINDGAGVSSATLNFAGDYLRLRCDRRTGKWWAVGRGHAEAPQAVAEAGTADGSTGWISPRRLFNVLRSAAANASETLRGVLRVGTQTEVDAGALDNVAVTPKKIRNGFSVSLGANGYIIFPTFLGGLCIQWMNASAQAGVTESGRYNTWPIAFPNTFFGCVLTHQGIAQGTYVTYSLPSAPKNGINLHAPSYSSGTIATFVVGVGR